MKWIKRAAIFVAVIFVIYYGAIYGYYFYLNRLPKDNRYLIPEGYVGWVVIQYIVKDSPPLPKENGIMVYKIPPTGEFKTSYNPTDEHPKENRYGSEYFYYSDSGLKPVSAEQIDWRGNQGKVEDNGKYSTFKTHLWVGTQEQYKKYGMKQYNNPKPGPIFPLRSNTANHAIHADPRSAGR